MPLCLCSNAFALLLAHSLLPSISCTGGLGVVVARASATGTNVTSGSAGVAAVVGGSVALLLAVGTAPISIWLAVGVGAPAVEEPVVTGVVDTRLGPSCCPLAPMMGSKGLPNRRWNHSALFSGDVLCALRSRRRRICRSRRTMAFVIIGGLTQAEAGPSLSLADGTRALQTGQRELEDRRCGSIHAGW